MKKSGINIKCFCDGCENMIYVKPFQVSEVLNEGLKKFCSKSCSSKTTKNKKKTGVNKTCLQCKITFYTQKNQNNYKFCSKTCTDKYRTNKPLLKKRNSIIINCLHCNKSFSIQKYRTFSAKYCSIDCATKHTLKSWKSHRYNPESLPKIELFGKENGYNFQHALNGGEVQIPNTRYFVDGYDSKKNVVIEYDEQHHFNKNGDLIQKDIIRQNKIIQEINCLFIRINYKNEIKIYDKTNIII